MTDSQSLQEKLAEIIDIARLAPSVHNTQPWRVQADNEDIVVSIDKDHTLKDGDPTGRQTIISLGIFCEAIMIAARHSGFGLSGFELENKTVRLHLKKNVSDSSSGEAVALLKQRCSDRSIYKPAEMTPDVIHNIEQARPDNEGIIVKLVTDPNLIATIADLTSHGIGLALSSSAFRKELSNYLVEPWSGKKRGISVKSLHINWFLAILQPPLVGLGISTGAEAALEKKRWLSASGVVVILGDGDLSKYWFAAGRSYLRASLAIEAAGLSQATSAAIVEASNYHDDIEDLLGTNQRILAMIRVGSGSTRRHFSPRLDTQDLIT